MEATKEREEFSRRLRDALSRAGQSDSPAALAREFNRRYPGKPVSTYAARKWLMADAIPSQDKLKVLAQWLKVNTTWLRFGIDSEETEDMPDVASMDYLLMRAIADLSEDHQQVVRELVIALKKSEHSR